MEKDYRREPTVEEMVESYNRVLGRDRFYLPLSSIVIPKTIRARERRRLKKEREILARLNW